MWEDRRKEGWKEGSLRAWRLDFCTRMGGVRPTFGEWGKLGRFGFGSFWGWVVEIGVGSVVAARMVGGVRVRVLGWFWVWFSSRHLSSSCVFCDSFYLTPVWISLIKAGYFTYLTLSNPIQSDSIRRLH